MVWDGVSLADSNQLSSNNRRKETLPGGSSYGTAQGITLVCDGLG